MQKKVKWSEFWYLLDDAKFDHCSDCEHRADCDEDTPISLCPLWASLDDEGDNGHWKEEPPTEPGVYAVEWREYGDDKGLVDAVKISLSQNKKLIFRNPVTGAWNLVIDWKRYPRLIMRWYSRPIVLPSLSQNISSTIPDDWMSEEVGMSQKCAHEWRPYGDSGRKLRCIKCELVGGIHVIQTPDDPDVDEDGGEE